MSQTVNPVPSTTPLVAVPSETEESNTTPWWKTKTAKITAASLAASAAVTAAVVAVRNRMESDSDVSEDDAAEGEWYEVDTTTSEA